MRRATVGLLALLVFAGCDPAGRFDILTTTLSDGRVGVPYSDTVRTDGGWGDVQMRIAGGQLPPGIGFRMTGSDAALYGTPTRAGDFHFTVEALRAGSDSWSGGVLVSRGLAITILP